MKRLSIRSCIALIAGAAIIAACGGGGHGSAGGGIVPQAQPPSGNSPMAFAWGKQEVAAMSYVGPAKVAGLSLAVSVRMQNPAGLVRYATSANTPGSANYRHWLTPQQIGNTYGATATDYAAAAAYFKGYGLQVGAWPQREVLTVTGSTATIAKAFGTTFGVYRYHGKEIVAPMTAPNFPTTVPITAAIGIVGGSPKSNDFIKNTNASYYGYAPQQIATGFDYSGAYNAGFNGSGINVGIIGTGPILGSSGKDDDLAAIGSYWKASLAPVTQVVVSPQPASSANGETGTGATGSNVSTFGSPPPITAPCTVQSYPNIPDFNTCQPEDGEAQLDTTSVASLAPGSNVLFYFAYNANEFCVDTNGDGGYSTATGATCPSGQAPYAEEGIDLTDDEIQQAIADDKADALSLSFGAPENEEVYYNYITSSGSPGLGQIEFASLATEGIAVFASSGDNGAWECQDPATGNWLGTACVNYPASDPNVVAVGGVNIPLNENGELTGAITAWADNTTLGGDGSFSNNVGSGGGVSSVFTPAPWQAETVGNSMRELPDISLDADPNSGPSVAFNVDFPSYASLGASGGTSAAAPEAAAQWALVLQACKASSSCNKGGATGYRLGVPTAYFYAIYGTSALASGKVTGITPSLSYANVFYDVLYGDNQAVPASPGPAATPSGYNSGAGYDQVTGLGAPFTGHLIQAITGTTVQ